MDPALEALAEAQNDVLKRAQLTGLGVTTSAIRAQVKAHRWTPIGAVAVVLHNGPLTRQQREWAAVLTAGRDAALAGRTALALAGLRGWEADAVHLLAPRGRTPSRFKDFAVVVHETRWPSDGWIGAYGMPPRTSVERAAIDTAVWSADPRTACAVLAAVVQQRMTTPERLLAVLARAGPVRHRHAMILALGDIAGGAQALTEIDFHRFCRKYRLGTVTGQVVRLDGAGRTRYRDCVIKSPAGAQVSVEIDGALHLIQRTYWQDMERSNELLIAGTPLLRFPSIAFRLEPARVADQVRRALVAEEAAMHRRGATS